MKKFFLAIFNRDNILITFFVALIIGLLSIIPINIEILNPLEQAFADFEVTDIVFSQIRNREENRSEIPADTNIVIVNIGNLSREEIAAQVNIINQYQPKVIGVDAFFRSPKDPTGDSLLAAAFSEVKNLVLVSKIGFYNEDKSQYDTLELSHPIFSQEATSGFANLITPSVRENVLTSFNANELATTRSFSPVEKVKGSKEYAFGVQIARAYNVDAVARLFERNNETENINFRGNFDKFTIIDIEQIFDPSVDLSFLRNKIVLMGYMGASINIKSLEDKFFTPLNPKYIGKAEPDMFGIIVHANIISMILSETYIDVMSDEMNLALSFIITFFIVALFSLMYKKTSFWYDGLSFVFQVVLSLILVFVVLWIFDTYEIKINLALSLLAVIFSPNLIEMYYGLVKKLYHQTQTRKEKIKKNVQ